MIDNRKKYVRMIKRSLWNVAEVQNMEFDHNGMIYFALKEESGQVVHISEMVEKDRGKACECICLCCGRPLVAKLGRGKKTAHFAHLAEEGRTTCSADEANESGLHKIAKEIICKSEYICLPQVTISEQNDPDRNMEDYKQQEIGRAHV